MKLFRHGDLLVKEIGELPKNLRKAKDNVLAYGEVTGHKHQLLVKDKPSFSVLEDARGNKFLQLEQATDLVHEEHKKITIQKGWYKVIHEREFDYAEEEMKRVVD